MQKIKIKENVCLMPLQPSQNRELFELIDSNREYLSEFMQWPRNTLGVKDSAEFIKLTQEQWKKDILIFGVFVEDKLVGVCSFNYMDKTNLKTDLGYWIAKDYQGQGIISLAVKELMRIGFDKFKLNRIGILCASINIPSQSIPKRLGFTYEGTLRNNEIVGENIYDHHVYGMTKEEYKTLKEK